MASHRRIAGRGALGWFIILAAILESPVAAEPVDRWSRHIAEASARFGVPAAWIRRVMRAESGGRTMLDGRPITSHAGAMGLMQLMPGTWAEMRAAHGLGLDPHDPRANILAGTAYLRALYDWFGYPGVFAAYNAGPDRYAQHLERGRRLPAETVAYVAAVGGKPDRLAVAPLTAMTIARAVAADGGPIGGWAGPSEEARTGSVFVALVKSWARIDQTPPPAAPSPLFARLSADAPAPE